MSDHLNKSAGIPPRGDRDTERRIAGCTVRVQRNLQPPGWAYVTIYNLVGQYVFQGVVREDDIALEVVDHLDRNAAYTAALERHGQR